MSDDAIAQQHVLDAIHEARKSGGKRQFDLTTDTPERYVADQNKGDHVATQSVHRPNWLKVTVGRINEQFVIVLITDVSDVIRFAQVRDSFITNVSEQLLGPTEALAKLADSLESGNLDEQQVAADARRVRSSCSSSTTWCRFAAAHTRAGADYAVFRQPTERYGTAQGHGGATGAAGSRGWRAAEHQGRR